MRHLIIGLFTIIMLSGCVTHKKVKGTMTVEHTEATANIVERSAQVISADNNTQTDIFDNYDLTLEFTQIDVGGVVEDSAYCSPTGDIRNGIPMWLYNVVPSPVVSSVTVGKLTLTGAHTYNSTLDCKYEAKAEESVEQSTSEKSDSENHQFSSVTGLTFWKQLQIWGFRIAIPLILIALAWIFRKQIKRILIDRRA